MEPNKGYGYAGKVCSCAYYQDGGPIPLNMGWICPLCHRANSPSNSMCGCAGVK